MCVYLSLLCVDRVCATSPSMQAVKTFNNSGETLLFAHISISAVCHRKPVIVTCRFSFVQ